MNRVHCESRLRRSANTRHDGASILCIFLELAGSEIVEFVVLNGGGDQQDAPKIGSRSLARLLFFFLLEPGRQQHVLLESERHSSGPLRSARAQNVY